MLISLHMPKTAGESFAAVLRQAFADQYRRDYADTPLAHPPLARNTAALQSAIHNAEADYTGVDCIHGHFLPLKYLLLHTRQPLTFITWLRHPVERALSHYYYWQRKNYDLQTAHPLYVRMIQQNWSAEQFCLSEEMRNIYHQFLWGFPLDNFDFIGITENFAEHLNHFAERYLHTSIATPTLNINQQADSQYNIDPSLRQKIQAFHHKDMQLYQRVAEKSADR